MPFDKVKSLGSSPMHIGFNTSYSGPGYPRFAISIQGPVYAVLDFDITSEGHYTIELERFLSQSYLGYELLLDFIFFVVNEDYKDTNLTSLTQLYATNTIFAPVNGAFSFIIEATFEETGHIPELEPVDPDPSTIDPDADPGPLSANQGYIRTRSMTDETGGQYLERYDYFDGLGRPVQTVQTGATPSCRDLVSIQQYDGFGREHRSWLPVPVDSNNGAYVNPNTVMSSARQAYDNDLKPYSFPVYEESPLGRVTEQYGVGEIFSVEHKAVRTEFLTNNTTEILNCVKYIIEDNYYVDYPSVYLYRSSNYSPGEMQVTRMEDEDGNTSLEFKDKKGRVVLTRQVLGDGTSRQLLDTYYVYHERGNLSAVLPPIAAEAMHTGSWDSRSSDILNQYAYLYKYDGLNRCIYKKLPGADWVYMVYDKGDRLVMSQDGVQRGKNEWMYVVYDNLNRPVRQNLIKTSSSLTQEQIQAKFNSSGYVAAYPTTADSWRLSTPFNEPGFQHVATLSESRFGGYGYLNASGHVRHDYIPVELAYDPVFSSEGGSGNVLITEIMYDSPLNEQIATGAAYSNGEYIELFNASPSAVDLTGWRLTGGGSTETYLFPNGTVMPAKSHLLVAYQYNNSGFTLDQLYGGVNTSKPVLYQRKVILSNSGEQVSVIDPDGNVVDAIFYDGTSNKSKADRLSATNEDNTAGMACMSLHRKLAGYDADGFAVAANSDWITASVSPFSVPDMTALSSSSGSTELDNRTKGLLTYEKVALLDGDNITGDFIERAFYYDYRGRVIQTAEKNHLGGISRYSTKYDFVGNVLASHESHAVGEVSDIKLSEFTYDHRGRLLSETTTLNGGEPAVVNYGYDELGRLASKTCGTGTDAVAEAYAYNIQGWLTGKTSNVFDMRLRYYDPLKPGTAASYTGNITEWEWRHKGANTDGSENTYAFTYDKLSRLTDTRRYTGISTTPTNAFTERGISYDRNGNMLAMKRYQSDPSTPEDNMAFTAYEGNQLTTLVNNGDSYGYEYDANGNMTSDGLNALKLEYNFLNLTSAVSDMSGNVQATYGWLADGRKTGVKNAAATSGYEYSGSLVYKRVNGELQLESTAFGGGRIVVSEGSSGTVYTPNYYITDHLGSTRAISDGLGNIVRSDFLPYGTRWTGGQAATSRYQFTGYEDQELFDRKYMDAGARFYNGITFNTPDPLSEIDRSVSPYAYVGNNPVKYIDPKGKEKIIAYDKNDKRNNTLIPAAIKYRDDLSIHIFAHGNSGGFEVFMDRGNAVEGIWIDTPKQFEDFLNEYSQTWQSRSPDKRVIVVLHSCETGQERNGKSSIARKISTKLKNVTIIAPDEKLVVSDKSGHELGPFRTPDKPNITTRDLNTPGNWRYYESGMNTYLLYNTPSPPKNFGQDPYQPLFFPSFYSFPSFSTGTIEIPYIEYEFLP